jgi:hypothetical protein
MLHLRLTGIAWLSLGVLGACASSFDLARNIVSEKFASVIESDIIALSFCATAALVGYHLLCHRRWARLGCAVLCVVLFLYAVICLLMVGSEFGAFCLTLILAAAAFSVYSFVVTLKYRQKA